MKKWLIMLGALLVMLSGCGGDERAVETEFFAMDTYMSATAYGREAEAALAAAEAEVGRVESQMSVTQPDSEVSQINDGTAVTVSQETAELVNLALTLGKETEGYLDITIHPVFSAWGFLSGEYRVPDANELTGLLHKVDYRKVQVDGTSVSTGAGVEINLGAIAKGYAGDCAVEAMAGAGVTSAMINLGGDVHTLGAKPDGSLWRIAIADPDGNGYIGVVSVQDRAVITSGTYERFFVDEDGTSYHHIIDPYTGYPADSALDSVTVVAESAAVADGLATALLAMGLEQAGRFWESYDGIELILVTEDREIYITEGLEDSFESAGDVYWVIRR